MSHETLTRLKYAKDAPRELSRALDALGQTDSDRARIARVEQKLGALLDAAPPASHTGWLQRVLFKSLTGKLLTTALLAFVGAGLLSRSAPTEVDAPIAPKEEAPAEESIPSFGEKHVEPQERRAPEGPVITLDGAPSLAEGAPRSAPQRDNSSANKRMASRLLASVPARVRDGSPRPLTGSTASNSAGAPKDVEAEPQTGARSPTSDAATSQAPEPPTPESPLRMAPLTSETDLVLSARAQLKTNPALTLSLLEKHAVLYPNGMLTPEREVLTIEALRNLGRNADAEQRLVRFLAQYPDSPHLRVLR